jgi:HD-GYP domain-containing protein (c-di-GMP phosphodiesterase class II)/HAMP domain-containing protein
MVQLVDAPSLTPDTIRQRRGRRRRPRLPLQWVAALGVIALLLTIVSLLGWQSYRATQSALIVVSEDTTTYIRSMVLEKARRILEPAEIQLNVLAHNALATATTLDERLAQVPLVTDALLHNDLTDAIYVGYANGEFVLFRPLRTVDQRRRFSAPDNAVLLVQSVTLMADRQMRGEYRLYDRDNALLSARVDPDYQFDPRTRPWYRQAIGHPDITLSAPYVFFTTGAIGITLARQAATSDAIIGIDAKLVAIANEIAGLRITDSSEIALIDQGRRVVAYRDMLQMIKRGDTSDLQLANIDDMHNVPLLAAADLDETGGAGSRQSLEIAGRHWLVSKSVIEISPDKLLDLLIAIPEDELLASARKMLAQQIQIAALLLVISIPLAFLLTRKLVQPLRRLAKETAKIGRLDFTSDFRVRSHISEIDELARTFGRMRATIGKFLEIGQALAAERDFRSLLDRVLEESIAVIGNDGGAVYMLAEDGRHLVPEILRWERGEDGIDLDSSKRIALDQPGLMQHFAVALERRDIVVVEQRIDDADIKLLGLRRMINALQPSCMTIVIVPLLDRQQNPFGLLILVKANHAGEPGWRVDTGMLKLIHAVSGSASVAIQNKQLFDGQRKLIEALIKLVAGAIDAKSPYTGGHCQRVPVLTRLLAEAAVKQTDGPYAGFALSEEEWEALDIAAWLHDCGKVTTPEYVVDKATKLETIYDRIHEIRMRFEVLKRDAEIGCWQGIAEGGDREKLLAELASHCSSLDAEFDFVAHCNLGGEAMAKGDIDRLAVIAKRQWTRTLSNRLGVSHEERRRLDQVPEPALPVIEPLLSDRPEHIIPHRDKDPFRAGNPWGFQLEPPACQFNRGELYNLSISRGTLTPEERFRINDHIVQTIMMLESLPFPKHLRSVPELAGGHHEKMDGTGYPKRLRGGDMSIVARMMAIADVFEALTAADRPYKKAKMISEAMRIMGAMKRDNHLDPDLLDLFVTSGAWRDYATRFLLPEQIDEPDIASILQIRPRPG